MIKIVTLTIAAVLLTGCATRGAGFSPIVDSKYKDLNILERDVGECQDFAKKQMGAGGGAAFGAIAGALLGAALAPRGYRNNVAAYGAVTGGLAGGASANQSQEMIIKRCLSGRGYNVLN
jgi:outer membrane lipoprotein SlyB